jgi:hypothetical protein
MGGDGGAAHADTHRVAVPVRQAPGGIEERVHRPLQAARQRETAFAPRMMYPRESRIELLPEKRLHVEPVRVLNQVGNEGGQVTVVVRHTVIIVCASPTGQTLVSKPAVRS